MKASISSSLLSSVCAENGNQQCMMVNTQEAREKGGCAAFFAAQDMQGRIEAKTRDVQRLEGKLAKVRPLAAVVT